MNVHSAKQISREKKSAQLCTISSSSILAERCLHFLVRTFFHWHAICVCCLGPARELSQAQLGGTGLAVTSESELWLPELTCYITRIRLLVLPVKFCREALGTVEVVTKCRQAVVPTLLHKEILNCTESVFLLRLKLAIVNLGLISSACSKHFNLLEVMLIVGLGVGGRGVGENCDAGHLVRNSTIMCTAHRSTAVTKAGFVQRYESSFKV
jgi:hypothetical protein